MVAELSSSTAAKLLVVAAAWFMSRDIRAEDLVPAWDGDLAKADDYQIDVTAYVRGTRRDERYVCGPRPWRKLQGRAKQAAKDVDWDELERDGGAQYLIKHIRKKLGAQPSPSSWSQSTSLAACLARPCSLRQSLGPQTYRSSRLVPLT